MAFGNISTAMAIPAEATASYTFPFRLCDAGLPTLTCRHAGDGTPGYKTAAWHAANAHGGGSKTLSEDNVRRSCLEDAQLIADHCVVSWQHVVEEDGVAPRCTPVKVLEFLTFVINAVEGIDTFVAFRAWVRNGGTFRPAQRTAAELGKP